MLVSMSTPTSESRARALSAPPSSRAVACSETSHSRSESISVPSMSHRTAAGSRSAGIEVLGLRVVGHQRVRGLLGVQLQLLGQLDADPARLEQRDKLGAVVEVRAGAVAQRVAGPAVAEPEVLLDVRRVLGGDGRAGRERQLL